MDCRIVVAVLALSAGVAFAQRDLKDIPDPDPELERKTFQVCEGFEVNLFASDPQLAKPIQMNWDSQGRLWVASSEIYPHIEPGKDANDRIVVLEDTNNDGQSDKTTVFAGGLLIPTGVEPGDGGAYVANSTELVHLKDTDGDGKADQRRIVLSGFGTEDTHHILHTFRWGHDGQLYFNQSIYIHSHIETPHGPRRLGGGGIWKFRPETLQLEILCRGFVNTWGHHFDAWGQSFATDGAYGEGVNYVFPGSVFVTAPGAVRILKGLNPGSPKHCGLEVVSGRHLPDDWQGDVITNDFRGHRVCRFKLSEDGSGFASREQPEVIKSNHVAFRPIDVKIGPDGAIYIADWYNPIIQHGEVDFRDPRRDHVHGRIWRVSAKGRPLVPKLKLVGEPVETLVEALKSPEQFTRLHAKRQLKERGAETVLPVLANWVAGIQGSDSKAEHLLLEGLWTYQSMDVVEPQLLSRLLSAKDHRARAAAVRVLSQWQDRVPNTVDLLQTAVADAHPRVRLEAVRALALIPSLRSATLALSAVDQPIDQFLDFAVWQAARDLQSEWLPAAESGDFDFDSPGRLLFALQAVNTPAIVGPLVQMLKSGKVPAGKDDAVLGLIASLGGPSELRLVYDLAMANQTPAARRAALFTTLVDVAQKRKVKPSGELNDVAKLFLNPDPAVRSLALRAAGAWQLQNLRGQLASTATAAGTPEDLRIAALQGLAGLGGEESKTVLAELSAKEHPQPVRVQAVVALVPLDLSLAGKLAIDVLSDHRPGEDVAPLYRAFFEQKDGPAALVAGLGDRTLPEDAAKLGVRTARTAGRDLQSVIERLSQAGGLTGMARVLTPEQMQELVATVKEKGNAVRGEAIYRRGDLVCMKCHAIGGAGGLVGPDLTSIGASAQVDYLIDSLLQPSKAIKENFHSITVSVGGKVYNGIKVRQTDTELVLRDAEDTEVVIPVDDIDDTKEAGSLMPAGLTDSLTQPELIDLVRFLSELGKVGPYAPSQARVARRWQVLVPADNVQRDHLVFNPDAVVKNPQLPWVPAYTKVSGNLPVTELPWGRLTTGDGRQMIYVRCAVEVTTPGPVAFKLSVPDAVKFWIDTAETPLAESVQADLSPGRHTLTIGIIRDDSPSELRVELADVPGSKAQVQFVSGK